ncbi:hypothetical protein GH714_003235 [Hevea brasiliensis]|uniref:Uncharacterized protein n=1 Tax=Hevea brasiliensis TaxID=3981 RepID=A0A6A6KZU7_HEVBR|nr:hypothetical protein GH714_003235 [Hevea brasiliensis]
MNDAKEAPIKDPTTGKLAKAALVGSGAGEIASSAITALMEAAAKRIAQATFFHFHFWSLAVVFLVAVFAAASVSAQDLGDLSPAPSPAMDKGAAYSLGMSGAVICSSLFLSMLALLKH